MMRRLVSGGRRRGKPRELLGSVEQDLALIRATPSAEKVLDDSDVAALFGLEMTETARMDAPAPTTPKLPPRSKTPSKKPAETKSPAVKKRNSPRMARTKPEPKWAVLMNARKRRAQRQLKHPV
jgi:hypothetical protein